MFDKQYGIPVLVWNLDIVYIIKAINIPNAKAFWIEVVLLDSFSYDFELRIEIELF